MFYYKFHRSKAKHYEEIRKNLKNARYTIPFGDCIQVENKVMSMSERLDQKLAFEKKKSSTRRKLEEFVLNVKRITLLYSMKRFFNAYDVISILIIIAGKPALNSCVWISVANFIISTIIIMVIFTIGTRLIHLLKTNVSSNNKKTKTWSEKSLIFIPYSSNRYYTNVFIELECNLGILMSKVESLTLLSN